MIEIKCPRCEQYWYDDDEDGGRVRLCSRCVDQLRLQRGQRAEINIPFLIGVGMFLVFDVMVIALTVLEPAVFGKVMLGAGIVMSISGGVFLKFLNKGAGFFARPSDIDWVIGRWALLSLLSGLACLGAYGSFVGFGR